MVAAIGAAAAVAGAAITANGAANAEDAQYAASQNANGQLNMANSANALRMQPWVNSGQNANSALQYYLGLGGSKPGEYNPGSLSGGWDNLVNTVSGGVANPNMALYENNPDYKAAFDDVWAYAQGQGGVDKISATAFDQMLKQRLQPAYDKERTEQATNSSGDSQFGSLLKQYTGQNLLNEDPGYQFRLDQGNKSINAAAAAAGRYDSGAALKSLAQYGQDYASNEYGAAFNRDQTNKQSTYNMLTGQSQIGQNSAAGVGAQGNAVAGQTAANTLGAGNAAAASSLAQSNQYANALNSMASGYAGSMGASSGTGGVNSSGMNALGTKGVVGGTSSNPWYG